MMNASSVFKSQEGGCTDRIGASTLKDLNKSCRTDEEDISSSLNKKTDDSMDMQPISVETNNFRTRLSHKRKSTILGRVGHEME